MDIPWAGVGAFLLGIGSALSGIAAVMTAKRASKEVKDGDHPEDNDSSGDRVIDGGR
jgi:hypothetical protein